MRYTLFAILFWATACEHHPQEDDWSEYDYERRTQYEDPTIPGDPAMPLGGTLRPCVTSQLDDPGCNN